MSSLSVLESRWQLTGDVSDERALISALINAGRLERRRAEMAAALDHPGAQYIGLKIPELPIHYRSKIELAVSALDPQAAVGFALRCAERVLDRFESIRAGDSRPRHALDEVRLSLANRADEEAIGRVARAASDAAIDADDPDVVPADPKVTAAISSANAASSAAFAAQNAVHMATEGKTIDPNGVNAAVSYAARFAMASARDTNSEADWQRRTLIEFLLGRA